MVDDDVVDMNNDNDDPSWMGRIVREPRTEEDSCNPFINCLEGKTEKDRDVGSAKDAQQASARKFRDARGLASTLIPVFALDCVSVCFVLIDRDLSFVAVNQERSCDATQATAARSRKRQVESSRKKKKLPSLL